MTPEKLLELFSINQNTKGALMFIALVYSMCDGGTLSSPSPGLDGPHAIAELCKVAHMPRPAVYSIIKRTLAPVFEADAATLRALGLEPQTSTIGLAREIIRSMEGGK